MITLFTMKENKNIQEKNERERDREREKEKQCNKFQSANVERYDVETSNKCVRVVISRIRG